MADWHKTQTKYKSKSQPILGKISLILYALRFNLGPLPLWNQTRHNLPSCHQYPCLHYIVAELSPRLKTVTFSLTELFATNYFRYSSEKMLEMILRHVLQIETQIWLSSVLSEVLSSPYYYGLTLDLCVTKMLTIILINNYNNTLKRVNIKGFHRVK